MLSIRAFGRHVTGIPSVSNSLALDQAQVGRGRASVKIINEMEYLYTSNQDFGQNAQSIKVHYVGTCSLCYCTKSGLNSIVFGWFEFNRAKSL